MEVDIAFIMSVPFQRHHIDNSYRVYSVAALITDRKLSKQATMIFLTQSNHFYSLNYRV